MSAPKLEALEALLIDGWKRELLRITLDNDQELRDRAEGSIQEGRHTVKLHEQKLREERGPYTLVLTSGERAKVRSHDHIFLPPTENENGRRLTDAQRADFSRSGVTADHFGGSRLRPSVNQ
jgi:hypothetical protein